MIIERALLDHVTVVVGVDTYGAGHYGQGIFGEPILDNLVPFLTSIRIRRGGARDGLSIKTDVGLMTLVLNDAYDPLTMPYLTPGQAVVAAVNGNPIFTGTIAHLEGAYPMNKQTGKYRVVTTVTVADAVSDHGKTPRYGVRANAGYETFEDRVTRLADSARTPVAVPEHGAPREVYSF